ncbi:hypothetical protein B9Z51_01965 [Limnohabitans sp. T6-5]|uniref:hypothetical protein n=1 Tax=Limnohabitans sp. T6-5 TaxID=1100724 RepID=UPI000D3D70BA|nr:hypothetical protein [Limnohabitans sp. T6-5]PUE11111.1 hypothetical protein B9Z51_01965 [Limnohabitans sp. T6-5]
MNSLPASTDANPQQWPWSPADRLRIEKCMASIHLHGQSLALFCTSTDFLNYNCQMLVDQLKAQSPHLAVEHFSGEKSQPLLAKINERLADLSIDVAMKPATTTSVDKVWVVENAQLLPVQELSLLQRLLKHFPGFRTSLILLFTGPEQALPQSNDPGTRIESWIIPWVPPVEATSHRALTLSRTSWAALATGVALIAAGVSWQTLAPLAQTEASAAALEKAASSQPTASSATALMPAASELPAASETSAASDAQQQTTAQATAAPAVAASSTPALASPPEKTPPAQLTDTKAAEASNAVTQSKPAASAQEPLPPAAVKGVRWLHTLPKDSFLIEHGLFGTTAKAQNLIQSKTWLVNARIVPVYERDQTRVQFSVVTGPFRSQERAQTFKARQELPGSKIRTLTSVMSHSQVQSGKGKATEKAH